MIDWVKMLDWVKTNVVGSIVAAIAVALCVFLWRRLDDIKSAFTRYMKTVKCTSIGQSPLQQKIISDFKESKVLDLLVIRGLAILSLKDSLFHQLLSKKGKEFKVRCLMLNPNSEYSADRATEIGESSSAMSSGIKYSINEINELRTKYNLDMEVRLYDALPTWRYIGFDNSIYVSSYLPETDGYNTAMHLLVDTPYSHYNAHRRFFESLWAASKEPTLEDTFTCGDAIRLMKEYGCPDAMILHCKIVAKVATHIAENAVKENKNLDLHLIEVGALLHDIGKSRFPDIDHAYQGGEFIRSAFKAITDDLFRSKLANLVERHIGAGLSADDIIKFNKEKHLSIPVRDYIPLTMEEKIVALADKMVEGNHEKSFEEQLPEKIKRYGENSDFVRRITEWHDELHEYLK